MNNNQSVIERKLNSILSKGYIRDINTQKQVLHFLLEELENQKREFMKCIPEERLLEVCQDEDGDITEVKYNWNDCRKQILNRLNEIK
jgi:hypothetical protein